jgi:hypothetical protein
MLKHIWLCTACLLGSSLAAETIGNVEFQFPPSNYEWRVLVDDSILENATLFDGDDDDFYEDDEDDFVSSTDYQWGTPLDDEDDDDFVGEKSRFKMFTHREGDALEIFVAYQDNDPMDEDDEDDKLDTLESVQEELNHSINRYLPNHKFIIHSVIDTDEDGFAEWELNDGIQDIMHGFTRVIKTKVDGEMKSLTVLGYLTTSVRSEYNRSVWTNALNQARVSN